MEVLTQSVAIIRRAEGELRELLLRSAGESDYENVRLLADWAQQLRQMSQQIDSPNGLPDAGGEPTTQPLAASIADSSRAGTRVNGRSIRVKVRRSRKQSKGKAAKGAYPQFFREGDELVKLGWSKRQKAVYRHKAPKRVVLLVGQALQRTAKNGDHFVMDQILPIRDPESDAEVPSYQAYLSLAWLRKEKVIIQHGRQGYSLPSDTDLPHAVEERWKLLPKS